MSTRSSRVASVFWAFAVLCAVFEVAAQEPRLSTTEAPAQPQLSSEHVDEATVRLFGIKGVDVAMWQGKHTKYRMAAPVAGHGSGVVVSPDGLILTAHHVVDGIQHLGVQLPGSDRVHPARVVHADADVDCAFISIDTETPTYVDVPANGRTVNVRETVFAVGYPLDASSPRPSSSRGIVSGLDEDGNLKLDIAVNPGNSGGPVLDEQHALLGIVVARGNPGAGVQNIAIAIPLERIAEIHRKALAGSSSGADAAPSGGRRGAAELIAALVREGALFNAIAAGEGETSLADLATLRDRFDNALGGAAGEDPYVLAVLSSLEWNYAMLLHQEGKDWRPHWQRAAKLAHQAAQRDEGILLSSRFIRVARRRHYALEKIQPPPPIAVPTDED